jgi:hypothetical protein
MTGDEYRAIREALGLSRPNLAVLVGGSRDGSLIKKRETEEVAITAAAEAEIVALKAAHDAGRHPLDAAAEAARAKLSVAASQTAAATPLHATRLRLRITQDEMLYQLGEAGECEPPARSSYQAWERGRRSAPQWVLDAADDLEKNGPFEAPLAEATTETGPAASGWRGLVFGAAIISAIGGLAWLARRAVNAA